jgi:hypothetical protein
MPGRDQYGCDRSPVGAAMSAMTELVERRSDRSACFAVAAWRATHRGSLRARIDGSLRYVTAYSVADGIGQGVPRWSSSSGAIAPVDRVVRPPTFRTWEAV